MADKKHKKKTDITTPLGRSRKRFLPRKPDPDAFGQMTENFARFMGTPSFLIYMTIFCGVWLAWNTLMKESWQFDPRAQNFTLLTLMLSLQASYAAPLLLLAQNRQDDRDRVIAENDRRIAERNEANTEYLAREIAALRIALRDVATRDFVRSEIKMIMEELDKKREEEKTETNPEITESKLHKSESIEAKKDGPTSTS
ncbi:MAG: DUF1003 domain-containing protein [Micrococcaceae bacterium]